MLYYIIDHIPPRPMFLLHIHLLPNHAISITSGWLWSDSCMYHIKAVAQTDYRACLTCSPKDLEKANVEKWSQYQHWCVPAPGGWHFVFGKPMTDCFCSGKTVISILHGIQHVITSVCLEKSIHVKSWQGILCISRNHIKVLHEMGHLEASITYFFLLSFFIVPHNCQHQTYFASSFLWSSILRQI